MICLNCGCKLDLEAKFCPHCGKETPLNNENNIGKITIVREKKMLGFAIPFDVYIDDTKLGTLSNNSSLTTRSTLSMHEIKLVLEKLLRLVMVLCRLFWLVKLKMVNFYMEIFLSLPLRLYVI